MSKYILYGALPMLLVGCDTPDYNDYLFSYKCSEAQLELVAEEMEVCNETAYLSTYCFATAKKTQCDYIGGSLKND